MDYELWFWLILAVVSCVAFVVWVNKAEPQDRYHTFGFWEKNVDDMEDRRER